MFFFLFILALIARVLVSIVARCGKATANKRTSEAPLATSATISPRALHIANRRRRILTPDKSAFERRKHTTPSCARLIGLSCARCSFPFESGSSDSPNNVVACARLDKRADAVRMDVRRLAACRMVFGVRTLTRWGLRPAQLVPRRARLALQGGDWFRHGTSEMRSRSWSPRHVKQGYRQFNWQS